MNAHGLGTLDSTVGVIPDPFAVGNFGAKLSVLFLASVAAVARIFLAISPRG